MSELNTIEFEIRSVDHEERSITGLAVPYGEPSVGVAGYTERFERGAFADAEVGTPLFYNHDHADNRSATPVGSISELREEDDGLHIKAKFSSTDKAKEVYTLVKEGVLKSLSAGFNPIESRNEADGTVVRTKARLIEVSVLPKGAYKTAAVAEVRAASNNENKEIEMTDTNIDSEVVELREAFSDLERKVAVLSEGDKKESKTLFRASGGEFLKGLAAGDESAQAEFRAFTGATTADSIAEAAWVNRGLKLVEVNRKAYNLFNHKALPATGNTIEYPVVSSVSGSVAVQAAEGDDLTYNEVVLTTATADVKTYGGYTSLSKQTIQRSDVAYLETALDHLARNYGRATNAAVAAAATGATGVNTGTGITLATSTPENWINFVLEGSAAIEDNGLGARAEFVWVSRDVFNTLAVMTDADGRPLFVLNNDGVNSIGSANLVAASGAIAGMPLVVDAGLAAKTAFVGAAEAVEIYESAGAPYRLGDENVINLTEDFSLYGYMAIAVPNPKALFKVTVS